MLKVGNVELFGNGLRAGEFDATNVKTSIKKTEDGRLFVFQVFSKKGNNITLNLEKEKLTYWQLKQLNLLKNSGDVVDLTIQNGDTFKVILLTIDSSPLLSEKQGYDDDDIFKATLNFIEV